jgi:hypothetical protein
MAMSIDITPVNRQHEPIAMNNLKKLNSINVNVMKVMDNALF